MKELETLEGSIEEKCRQFSDFLGIEETVSVEVLQAAVEDENYARNILTTRNTPAFLNHLLANPPKSTAANTPKLSNTELIGRATKALVAWTKTGFSKVDKITLEQREDACLLCPNLSSPKKALQKMVSTGKNTDEIGQRARQSVCNLCGCNIAKKIRIPSEQCPDKHPEKEGYSRWNEELVS